MKKFNALTISQIKRETHDTVSVTFTVPKPLKWAYDFKAGQHIVLRKSINGQDVRRTYSLCSRPQDDALRVAIRRVEGGAFSGFANDDLKVGDTLEVGVPIGNFYYEPAPSSENTYVAFAAGSGITPVISILKTGLASEHASKFILFYGNRDKTSTIFLEDLLAIKNTYMERLSIFFFMSQQAVDGELFNGRIDTKTATALLDKDLCPMDASRYFVCGPSSMMDDTMAALASFGVSKAAIKSERFYVGDAAEPATPKTAKAAECQVTIVQDGNAQTLAYHQGDGSLLEAALAAGMDMSFACKGGVCATCRAKVTKGAVHQALNYGLEEEELAAGFVLTCQSVPTTKTLTLSFDD